MQQLTDSQTRHVSGGLATARALRPLPIKTPGPSAPPPQLPGPMPKDPGAYGLDPVPARLD